MLTKNNLAKLKSVFAASFILTISLALTSYIDSSFLETFIVKSRVGLLFTISALGSLIYIANAPKILENLGVFNTFKTIAGVYILAIIGLTHFNTATLVQLSFITYWITATAMYLTIDVLIEHYSDVSVKGKTRGFYLTIYNLAFLIAPFIAGILADGVGFKGVYITSGLFITLMIYFFMHEFKDLKLFPKRNKENFLQNFLDLFKTDNLREVYLVAFSLSFFFALMTIYMPIYLHQNIGFSWQEIGAIFAIMHIPYVLLEIPWGRIADNILGEKEIMGAGIIIIGLCTIAIGFISSHEFWVWACALSLTRIGASMVQVTTESYFFKKIKRGDTNKISIFRNASPIAMLVAPAVASIFLSVVDLRELFIILGIIVLLALMPNYKLHDTK